jgi:hypothetical protein
LTEDALRFGTNRAPTGQATVNRQSAAELLAVAGVVSRYSLRDLIAVLPVQFLNPAAHPVKITACRTMVDQNFVRGSGRFPARLGQAFDDPQT